MSNRSKNVSKNLIFTLIARLTYMLMGFITRKLIIQIVSIEYLGLSSLYANMLDLLNLAELGIGVAIQVRMYAPLVNGENDKVYNLIKVAQRIYNVIGTCVLVAGGLVSFLLQFLIKDNPFPMWYVQTAYLISVVGIAASYFCASKRLYFESNEKYYVISISELLTKILFTALAILLLYLTKEYLIYTGLIAIQSTLSNIVLSLYFRRACPQLRNLNNDKQFQKFERKIITKSMKDVIPMKLGVFIFSSTDGVVISSFIGLAASAIYSNYNLISLSLLSISAMVSNALVSTFGKIDKETTDKEYMLKQYKVYENMQYMFSIFTSVCLLLSYDRFMTAWVGEGYLIGNLCVFLLSLDYFIHSSFQPLSTLYTSTGKFKEDKICSLTAAALNIGLSILLVYFIGLPGVIIGTLVANIFTFIVRNHIINKKYFKRSLIAIVLKPLLMLAIFCIELVICYFATHYVRLSNKWLDFIVTALICAVITNIFNLILAKKLGYLQMFIQKLRKSDSKIIGLVKKILRPIYKPIYNKIKNRRATKSLKNVYHLTKGEIINIVFICQTQHIWNKMQPVVEALLPDNRFNVSLFLVDDTQEDDKSYNIFKDFALKNNVKFYEYKEGLLKSLNADYVIYPRPYDVHLPHDIQSTTAVNYARLGYIPYGYSTMKIGKVNLDLNFTRNIGLFFADMDYSFEYFNRNHLRNIQKKLQKNFNYGYPYLERLGQIYEDKNINSTFRKLSDNGFKIMWTPRWTADDKIGGSNFLRYIDKIFEEYVNNEEFSFVFRPHPYAFDNYVKLGILTPEKKEEYLKVIEKSTNSIYDNADDYFDTLKDADIAIMDVSSIVPERVITGKPIIFCHNENKEVLNDKMKEMLRYMYNAYSFEDIKNFVSEIKSGNDYLKAEREAYCKQFRESMVGTCERYKQAILKDYEERSILKRRI